MKIRVRDIRLPLDHTGKELKQSAARKIGLENKEIVSYELVKKAVDARRRSVHFTYTVDLTVDDKVDLKRIDDTSPAISILEDHEIKVLQPGEKPLPHSPLIVGAGPAGLFCALYLAQYGYKPVIIERGQDVDQRVKTVDQFRQNGVLNPESNTQFGEGGAGTFSDGKLTTRIGDERINYILKTFVRYGADEEILYLKKPHVGNDIIRQVVKGIRREILSLGGEIYFNTCLTDINVNQRCIESILINYGDKVECSPVIMAAGNSARDLYRLLYNHGVQLVPKAFAIGLRVEHPQEFIDQIQYGQFAGHPLLGAADYHLTFQDKETGRSLYTFCMCPGGYVINAASEPGRLVTNGMSYFARDTGVANSALVVTVTPADWDNTPLGGMEMQEELESRAFEMGGGNYYAPAQRLVDFLEKRPSESLEDTLATFIPGVCPANLWELLPYEVCEVMCRGINSWDKKMKGFISDKAVLTGIETRTSAPLRIVRDECLNSLSLDNLYPCGEGAGYAGGIISAALDGLRVAEKIITLYQPPQRRLVIESDTVLPASSL